MAVRDFVAAVTNPTRLKMSYEEFLAWSDDDTRAEWDASTGEVIIQMPPTNTHQITLGFLFNLLNTFVHLFDLGKVSIAPFEVKLKPGGSAREPDIFFVAKENLNRLTDERLLGSPDLIIEIISLESVGRDRNAKFKEYAEAGVREYWIIDPRPGKLRADFFRRDAQGQYELYATEDDERVESQGIPGFWLRPIWLWQADTLNPLTCALEIEEVAAALQEQINKLQSINSTKTSG